MNVASGKVSIHDLILLDGLREKVPGYNRGNGDLSWVPASFKTTF